MKTRNLLPLLLAGSMIVACGESMDANDAPLDAENGLETLDAKSDSFAVRPGSPEAEAVVAFANQALADNAAGTAFRDLLDSTMHKTAAKNVAKYRAGADGTFGTPDDKTFADLTALDKVPYVGRTALMQMLELADAAGYMNRTSLDCADYIEHDARNNYYIRSYAEMLEIENSHCSTINGNLTIQISGTDILPPSAREIQSLQHLESVTGNITIYATPIFNSINFKSLKTITGTLTATYGSEPMHTLEFPSLTNAPAIQLTRMKKNTFSKLESTVNLTLQDNTMEGFTALKTAGTINMRVTSNGAFPVDFPSLSEATNIYFAHQPPSSYGTNIAEFTGSFAKLTKVKDLAMSMGSYTNMTMPKLARVEGTLNTSSATNPYDGMNKLDFVSRFNSQYDQFTSQNNAGPKVLTSVGKLAITSRESVYGFEKLKTVESDLAINAVAGITGFNAPETVGGAVSLTTGNTAAKLGGFNKLSNVARLTINSQNNAVTLEPIFEALENVEDNLFIMGNRAFSTDIQFPRLLSIGGAVRIDYLLGQRDVFPTLEIIDGSLELNYAPVNFIGMDKLTHVEGDLSIGGALKTMSGLAKLNSIGSNLLVPRGFNGANLDAFLNQLTEFSGTITYR